MVNDDAREILARLAVLETSLAKLVHMEEQMISIRETNVRLLERDEEHKRNIQRFWEDMSRRVDGRLETHDLRIAALERFKAQILGAVAASGLLGGMASAILQWALSQ